MNSYQYPWWKRSVNFESQPMVKYMLAQKEGAAIVLFYECLISYTTNTDGLLLYQFGERVQPFTPELMAQEFNRPLEIVEKAMDILEQGGVLVPVEINGQTFQQLANIDELRGKPRPKTAAERMRASRARKRAEKEAAETDTGTDGLDLTAIQALASGKRNTGDREGEHEQAKEPPPFPAG